MTIGQLLYEPLALHFQMSRAARRTRVAELLEDFGLMAAHADRHPYELSGGQRQRVAIARAVAVEPDLIVLDEPVSALDVSMQGAIINLLEAVQATRGISYLFIAHDLSVVRHTSNRIAVMYQSRIVESGAAEEICERPAHPYTKMLLASAPLLDPDAQALQRIERRRLLVRNEFSPGVESCPYMSRCPYALPACAEFPKPKVVPSEGDAAP